MPLYDFINNNNGEQFEAFMSISAKDEYLEANPHIKQQLSPTVISMDSHRFMGVKKVDQGWKDVLKKVHEKTPGSQLTNTSSVGF